VRWIRGGRPRGALGRGASGSLRLARAALAGLLALLGSAPASAQGLVGLDAVHGFEPEDVLFDGSRYDELRAEIAALGMTPVPIASFDATSLAGLELLLIKIAYPAQADEDDFSPDDAAAIQAFVAAGGRLVALADAGFQSDVTGLNRVLEPYQMGFSTSLLFLNTELVLTKADLNPHPIRRLLASFGMLGFREILFPAGSEAFDFTATTSIDVIALNQAGGRKVMALGDSSLWKDDDDGPTAGASITIETQSNRLLLQNSLRWLTGLPVGPPVPMPALSPPSLWPAGLLVAAAGAWRLRRRAPRRG